DMQPIVFFILTERVLPGKFMKLSEDFVKIPRIFERKLVKSSLCFGGNTGNICTDSFRKLAVSRLVEQLKTINEQVFVLTNPYTRPPFLPTAFLFSRIQIGSEDSDDNCLHGLSQKIRSRI